MSLVTCADCTAAYPGELSACPQCHSTRQGGGSVLPSVVLCCRNRDCRFEGVQRRVLLRSAGPGVVELPRYFCAECSHEMERVMPKIHEGREPTYAPERESEGTGVPMEGVEIPADGSWSPEISGDGSGEVLPPSEPDASATAPPDYSALTVDQLRGLLAERDLSQAGKKADLIARLQEADAPTTGTSGVTIVAEATVTRPDGTTA